MARLSGTSQSSGSSAEGDRRTSAGRTENRKLVYRTGGERRGAYRRSEKRDFAGCIRGGDRNGDSGRACSSVSRGGGRIDSCPKRADSCDRRRKSHFGDSTEFRHHLSRL